jgi:hypothetical protein
MFPFSEYSDCLLILTQPTTRLPQRRLFLCPRIRLCFIGQPGKIIHTGIQRQRNALALLKGHIPHTVFNLGIIALVDAGQVLYFYLRVSLGFSQLLYAVHIITRIYYGKLTY